MKQWSRKTRESRKTIGFVPTMGYLHEGHLSLVRESLSTCDFTVVSIFINPEQFGPGEDLDTYPMDFEGDRKKLESLGIDVLFYPAAQEIYPQGFKTYVAVEEISSRLCGKSRPGFFRGVNTVALKLFNIVQPQTAYFGEKDSPKCGACDVCLERNKVELSKNEFEGYRIKILKLLEREPLTINELCEAFSSKKQAQVLKTVELLIDEGELDKVEDKIRWKK